MEMKKILGLLSACLLLGILTPGCRGPSATWTTDDIPAGYIVGRKPPPPGAAAWPGYAPYASKPAYWSPYVHSHPPPPPGKGCDIPNGAIRGSTMTSDSTTPPKGWIEWTVANHRIPQGVILGWNEDSPPPDPRWEPLASGDQPKEWMIRTKDEDGDPPGK